MTLDLYNQATAQDNGSTATPVAPEAAPVPEPAPVPDPVVAEQVSYTKQIQATAWAAQARWVSGMSTPTAVIMSYIQHLGYTTTASVDADIDTGIVTIVTTGAVLTDSLWQAFAGGSGAPKVEVTIAWTAFAESATTTVPGRDTVIGLWFYLERQGIGPITIFRRWDGSAYWLVLTTYGAIPAGVAQAYIYQAPTESQVSRIRVFSRNHPPLAGEQFYVALQADAVLEVQTGVDLAGFQTVSDIVPVAVETARAPAQVQEQRQLDVQVTPGYFEQATAPASPREGDLWVNTGTQAIQKRIQGAWVVLTDAQITSEGSTAVGRDAIPTARQTLLAGWKAKASGVLSTALGAFAEALASASTAVGSASRAEGFGSTALGRAAVVPATAVRGIALGYLASVPADTTERTVLATRDLQIMPPTGGGETSVMLRSADGTYRRVTIGNDALLRIAGILAGMTSPIPGAASATDGGYLMGQAIPSGMISEIIGEILTFGINSPQIGTRNEARVGGIFQLDSRSTSQALALIAYATGGSLSARRFKVSLQDGTTHLTPSGGNIAVGMVHTGTPTARLHLAAGSGIAGSAPLKLTSGAKLSIPEAGAVEYDGSLWVTDTDGARRQLTVEGHLHDSRYYTETEVNAFFAAARPDNAAAVRSTDSGLVGTTSYEVLGDPVLDIAVSSAHNHRVTISGNLRCEQVTASTGRGFYGKVQVNGVDGPASASSGVIAADHGAKVIETLPLVWAGVVPAGASSISVRIWFRATSSGTYLTIESGTSLIADVTPLV